MNLKFDVIVVGTGPGGATVAKELSKKNKKVLILERGGNSPVKDSLSSMASILKQTPVSRDLAIAHASTTGGTTSIYFAAAGFPPLDSYQALGIDLSAPLEEAKKEMPFQPLPDNLIGEQVKRVCASARQLGYNWTKTDAMFIDQEKCKHGYNPKAKWTARNFIVESVGNGATLLNGAAVTKVLVEHGKAIGVEFVSKKGWGRKHHQKVYADKIVLSAGSLSSPQILQASGFSDFGKKGFYCDPGYLVMGFLPGMKGGDLFPGSMGDIAPVDRLLIADGCLSRTFYRGFILGEGKFRKLFSHSKSVSVGVMIHDELGGELRADGSYYKEFSDIDKEKLQRGGDLAEEIVRNAGAKDIFRGKLAAAHVGGVLTIGEVLSNELETECKNLYVCDNSIIPSHIRVPPTLSLVCLGKYLANAMYN